MAEVEQMVFALFLLSLLSFFFCFVFTFLYFFLFLLISLFILFLFCFCFRPQKPELNPKLRSEPCSPVNPPPPDNPPPDRPKFRSFYSGGPPGFHTTCTFQGPRRFKHHQNSTKGPQERERRKKIVAERKKRNFPPFGTPPFWAPPFWAPPFGAPPFGPPPFGAALFLGLGLHPLGPHPSRAPHYVVPKF